MGKHITFATTDHAFPWPTGDAFHTRVPLHAVQLLNEQEDEEPLPVTDGGANVGQIIPRAELEKKELGLGTMASKIRRPGSGGAEHQPRQ